MIHNHLIGIQNLFIHMLHVWNIVIPLLPNTNNETCDCLLNRPSLFVYTDYETS